MAEGGFCPDAVRCEFAKQISRIRSWAAAGSTRPVPGVQRASANVLTLFKSTAAPDTWGETLKQLAWLAGAAVLFIDDLNRKVAPWLVDHPNFVVRLERNVREVMRCFFVVVRLLLVSSSCVEITPRPPLCPALRIARRNWY
ncbi:hypothetical protein GCM10027093_09090 [Paraburkholderia jirisanensis]